ncbi:hypothetical protein ACVMIL_006274 [Bradyrhizobium barranii subsp. barranii]
MSCHECRTRLEAAVDFRGDATPFLDIDEVQSQKACRAVERSRRCIVDIALMQMRARCERTQRLCRQIEHRRGRIHAIESPARLGLREGPQFEAAAGTERQYPGVFRRALGQQDRGHRQHRIVAGNEARRSLSVFRHHLRIGERALNVSHDIALLNGARHACTLMP